MVTGFAGFFAYAVCIVVAPRFGLALVFFIHADGSMWAIALGVFALMYSSEDAVRATVRSILGTLFHLLTGRSFIVERVVEKVRTVRSKEMTMSDAYECLGCRSDADVHDIGRGYRAMLQKVHPDHGGSPYLTRLVVQAHKMLEKA